jgi:D-alanyl-D-alanine dipeptidase
VLAPSALAPLALALSALPAGELVDAAGIVPDAIVDLRYATPDNVTGAPLYPPQTRCLLRRDVAARLAHAARRLRAEGYRVVLWDCHRTRAAQEALWARFPRRGFVADPRRGGSNHEHGAAVDVALAAADGGAVPLPTTFDAFGPAARADAASIPEDARRNRERLRAAMEAAGFRVNRMEWWHYDAPEARGAPRR